MPGTLFVVATPIGNLEDITVRALRVLRDVALIAAEDTRRTAHLLSRHAIATPTTSLHEHNEAQKSGSIIARILQGDDVAVVSDAGSPAIADPGQRLISDAVEAGIRVEPIPGPNAAITTLMVSGLATDSFCFLGFPPTRGKDRKDWFDRLAHVGGTVAFYEAPHRIASTLTELLRRLGDCRVIIGRELTKIHEELVRGPISTVLQRMEHARGEFTVVVDIGLTTKINHQSTESLRANAETRRQAVADLAKLIGLTPNQLYSAIEQARK
jgi:16S rRNA (cytidine1402-2'-O)-methyltransferase